LTTSSLFFILLLRPPASSLFPYTTLFRSRVIIVHDSSCQHSCHLCLESWQHVSRDSYQVASLWQRLHRKCNRLCQQIAGHDAFEDRKSTRLNSSHLGISYAVFCLKKKNII